MSQAPANISVHWHGFVFVCSFAFEQTCWIHPIATVLASGHWVHTATRRKASHFTEETVGSLGGPRPVLKSLRLCREMWGMTVNSMGSWAQTVCGELCSPTSSQDGLCDCRRVILPLCAPRSSFWPDRHRVVVRGERGISTCRQVEQLLAWSKCPMKDRCGDYYTISRSSWVNVGTGDALEIHPENVSDVPVVWSSPAFHTGKLDLE